MIILIWLLASAISLLPQVYGLASTDSPRDVDPGQSGYLPNNNMDPAVVDSAQFGQLWKQSFNSLEQFYAKPLVYTPLAGGNQLLFLASSQNWIRTLDAKTGDLINSRQVQTPFLQSDIGCTDIPNTIGIIGTPVIDTNTDIVYFFAKTYIPNYRMPGNTGTYNGVYYFYGVDINTLEDAPGFPILVDGSQSDNAPEKYFVGGVILQRPSLLQVGSVVYGGFGGHCDLFNYTGLVVGIDINQKQVVTNFAVESGPLAPQTNVWDEDSGGGEGGIWMSGFGLSSDGNRLFWVSGNGDGHENNGAPAPGSSGCRTLGEAVVNLAIGDGGMLSLTDYFQPYDYQNMDGGDQDFGSSGLALLDPGTFHGTGVSKIGVASGKNGKIYILNANNLGGYKEGPGQTDGIVQTIVTNDAVFGGAGSYPGEGGYIYLTPVGFPTFVYKLGFDGSGVPQFTRAGTTTESSAGRVGVGLPTITTLNGQEGTAILWMCDPDAGLRAWYAVPNSDSTMKSIPLPQVNGLNKFQRPVFGDTRLYVTDAQGTLYCLGSPVNLPLNCSSPVNFGSVALGSAQTELVNCKANVDITNIASAVTGDAHFQLDISKLPQGAIKAGSTFSFPVTWNLTNTHVANSPNASYGNVAPGVKSTALTITTVNAVAGFSTEFPLGLTGLEVSNKAFLVIEPTTVDYSGIVILDPDDVPTSSLTFTIQNAGLADLTIQGYAYTTEDIDDDDVDYTNVTNIDGAWDLGYGFTSSNLPTAGTVLSGGETLTVDSTFDPINGTSNYNSFLTVWTDGGEQTIILEGSASTAPIANFSISTSEGGWLPSSNLLMDFGDVSPGASPSLQIRICNQGGSVLQISKSKPPNGIFRLDDPTDLHESQDINIDDCAYGTVIFATTAEELNEPDQVYTNTWTLNTDDLTFGVHVVQIQGTVVSRKVGPTNSTGQPVYTYLGCYTDNAPGERLLRDMPYANNSNTNDLCQTECNAGDYIFAGTEYQIECYCGNIPPPNRYQVEEIYCTFACAGDATEVCGGNGGYESIYYDATRYTPSNDTSTTVSGPVTVNQTGNYNYIGCYSEATNGRALSGAAPAAPNSGNTIESCAAACSGYTYFGTEYSNECYCGNTINAGSVNQASSDPNTNGCSMLCGGNVTEYCGGPNRLDMYQLNGSAPAATTTTSPGTPTPTPGGPSVVLAAAGFVYAGCYVEGTGSRALTGLANPVPGATLTVELCAAACKGYTYMGVEYGGECYCGNTINGGSALASGGSDPTQNQCSMTCNGNATEYCGGPNRLNFYQYNATTTSTATSTPVSNTTTSATPSPTGPITVGNTTAFSYLGCYSEGTNGRALSGLANPGVASQNTVETCGSLCSQYTYFGVEYSGECYCGNSINAGSALVAGSNPATTGCNMLCNGNSSEYCGGANRLNMYSHPTTSTTSTTTTPTTPTPTSGPVHVQVVGNYVFQGCWNESSGMRSLSGQTYVNASMTIEMCAATCNGFAWMGVEYGQECYCGTAPNAGSANVTLSDCNFICPGNSSEYCGAGNRLEMYKAIPPANLAAQPSSAPPNYNSSTTALRSSVSGTAVYSSNSSSILLSSSRVSLSASAIANSTARFSTAYSSAAPSFLSTGALSSSGYPYPTNSTARSSTAYSSPAPSFLSTGGLSSSGYPFAINSTASYRITGSVLSSSLPYGTGLSSKSSLWSSGVVSSFNSTISTRATSVGTAFSSANTSSSILPSKVSSGLASSSANTSNPILLSTGVSTKSTPTSVNSTSLFYSVTIPLTTTGPSSINATSTANSSTLAISSRISTIGTISNGFTSSANSSVLATSSRISAIGTISSGFTSSANSSSQRSSTSVSSVSAPPTSTASINGTSSTKASSIISSSLNSSVGTTSRLTSTAVASSNITSGVASPTRASSSIFSTSTAPTNATFITTSSISSSSLVSSGISFISSNSSRIALSTGVFSSKSSSTLVSSSQNLTTSASSTPTSSSTSGPISSSTISSITSLGNSSSTLLTASISPSGTISSTSSKTSTTAVHTPTPGEVNNGWSYLGCANETNPRALSGSSFTSTSGMTIESCQSYCSNNNYGLAGLEYGSECYCGNGLQNYAAVGKTGCTQLCSGNSSEICGAANLISVYNSTTFIPPSTVKQVGYYTSQGCYPEATNGRILTGPSYTNSTGMTVESCVGYCQAAGQNYAGLEYAQECYCGASIQGNVTAVDTSKCSMTCTGNPREFCGGSSLLNVYENTANSVSSRDLEEVAAPAPMRRAIWGRFNRS